MKLVFILVLTTFTVCKSRELHRHRHEKKFPQGSETLQRDAHIGPKPGVEHNRLFPEYGTNFRYIGGVKHGLDRVTVVTSIPMPKYSDIRKKPLQFNCTIDLNRKEAKTVGSYQYRVHKDCAKVMPYVRYMQNQEKSEDEKEVKNEKRGIGAIFSSVLPGLITLAVESLTSWIKDKQQRRIHQAVDTMRKTESEVKNTLSQYQDNFLMFGKYSVKSLKTVIDTLNILHDKQTDLEKLVTTKLFTEAKYAGDTLDYSVEMQLFLELAQKEHVTKYKEVDKAGRELLDAITILSQRRLPRSLFPDQKLKGILTEVDRMVKKNYLTMN